MERRRYDLGLNDPERRGRNLYLRQDRSMRPWIGIIPQMRGLGEYGLENC